MSKQNDGGPAFPVADLSKTQCPGMSLRDYFAGQALAGLLAGGFATDPAVTALAEGMGMERPEKFVAACARRHADALMEELDGQNLGAELLRQFRTLRNELRAFGPRPEIDAADALLAKLEERD